MGPTGDRPEFDTIMASHPDLVIFGSSDESRLSAEVFSPMGYFRKTAGFEIRVFPLLGELPKAIELHLSVCLLCRWQLNPTNKSSPMTKSLHAIVVSVLRVCFLWESLKPATGRLACNCPVPEPRDNRGVRTKVSSSRTYKVGTDEDVNHGILFPECYVSSTRLICPAQCVE